MILSHFFLNLTYLFYATHIQLKDYLNFQAKYIIYIFNFQKEQNKVYETEFIEGIKYALLSNESKIKATFEAMKFSLIYNDRNYLEFIEIFEFFIISWNCGLDILYDLLNKNCKEELNEKNIFIPPHHSLNYLIKKYENVIKTYLIDSFLEFGMDVKQEISYDMFKLWILKNHDLEIVYHNKRLKIAVSMICLNDIGLLII